MAAETIPGFEFKKAADAAQAFIDALRPVVERMPLPGDDAMAPEELALHLEARNFAFAVQCLAAQSPLSADGALIALGGAAGVLLAQCEGDKARRRDAFNAQVLASCQSVTDVGPGQFVGSA